MRKKEEKEEGEGQRRLKRNGEEESQETRLKMKSSQILTIIHTQVSSANASRKIIKAPNPSQRPRRTVGYYHVWSPRKRLWPAGHAGLSMQVPYWYRRTRESRQRKLLVSDRMKRSSLQFNWLARVAPNLPCVATRLLRRGATWCIQSCARGA